MSGVEPYAGHFPFRINHWKTSMKNHPRVALFADTYHETNGAANVIRRLQVFAGHNDYPFLCVCAGDETRLIKNGNCLRLELKRSKFSLPVDGKLKYDPLLWRHLGLVKKTFNDFSPDILHLTGLNDVSQIGFYLSHHKKVDAVASWHTNTHEYAAKRLLQLVPWLSENVKNKLNRTIEKSVLYGLMQLYRVAQLQLAPNEELVRMIGEMTRRPSFLMSRGVDLELFSPDKRSRNDDAFVIGYVGRLRPEKNVRFLAEIDAGLKMAKVRNYKFVIVGEGSDSDWLEKNLSNSELTGVLHGEELARAYADMDLFVFPSLTDAFGNVVLEAMAAGVPSVVMPNGGPKYLIEHNFNGYAASDSNDFIEAVVEFVKNPETAIAMRKSARQAASARSWERVFEDVYQKYQVAAVKDRKIKVKEKYISVVAE